MNKQQRIKMYQYLDKHLGQSEMDYIDEIIDENEQRHAELDDLRAENARLKQQLQAESTAYYLLRDERDSFIVKLAAAEKIFNHFGGLSELMKWENGQGETAANIVQEYLEL